MNPPCSPGVDSIASQYSASVPLLLPIACEYSHMMSGCRWLPDRAWATIDEMAGYIGRVVRGPDGVEPELLHLDQVGAHGGRRDGTTGSLVEVVAVDAAQKDPAAVEEEVPLPDLHPPKADPELDFLGRRAVRSEEPNGQ